MTTASKAPKQSEPGRRVRRAQCGLIIPIGGVEMKKTIIAAVFATFAITSVASTASAKCFAFSDADIKVCIDGNDNATRRQAQEVCEDATGDDCGNITGYSGSCNGSNCYDESGDQVRSISVD